jgi:predicted O-methyltransferase YrrM
VLPQLLEQIYASGKVEDGSGEALDAFPHALPREHTEELIRLVREEGARDTLETGMAYGISTIAIAGVHDDSKHIAIDPYQSSDWRGVGILNVQRAGLADRVRVIEERSDAALPQLVAEGVELDLALIDGSHLFDYTLVDFFHADRMLRTGGVVVFHDTWMPAVRQAASFVIENRDYQKLDAGDDAMWALRKTGEDDRAWDFHREFLRRTRRYLPSVRARITRS